MYYTIRDYENFPSVISTCRSFGHGNNVVCGFDYLHNDHTRMTRSWIRQEWSSRAIRVSNQRKKGPTGKGDGGGQCGSFVFADLVTIIHRVNKRIGMDVFMSAQCCLDWGHNLGRTERMFQRSCTNPRLGFETTDDYPYGGVPWVLSIDWSHCHHDGVIRYLVDKFSEFRDKKDFRAGIAKFFDGPAYPCMGTMQSHLLRNQDKLDDKDVVYHGVLIVGADFRSTNPEDHSVHIKNSWGKDWCQGGFCDVSIDPLSYICVPHYSPV